MSILVLAACKDSSESARSSPKRLGKKVSEKRSTNHLTYRERPYIVDQHKTHEASKQPDSRAHMSQISSCFLKCFCRLPVLVDTGSQGAWQSLHITIQVLTRVCVSSQTQPQAAKLKPGHVVNSHLHLGTNSPWLNSMDLLGTA